MAKFDVARFADPDVLKTISSSNLYELLKPWASYLASRGVTLLEPAMLKAVSDDFGIADDQGIDYDGLAKVLATPDDTTPGDMVNALYLVSECRVDQVLERIRDGSVLSISTSQEQSSADIVTQVYLRAPYLIERLHSEQFVGVRKSFHYFLTTGLPQGAVPSLAESSIKSLEHELASWFERKKMGNQVRVHAYPQGPELLFLVRHGEGFRRQSVQKKGRSTSVFFRPEKHDIVAYTHSTGELRINAEDRERELYRCAFGRHLGGDENHFRAKSAKYSLDSLRNGLDSISCADIEGIESVTLTEIWTAFGGAHNEVKTHRASDIFAAIEDSGDPLLGGRLITARFEIRFSDSKTPRTVQINPPARAKFTRDSDGARVSEWLFRRGFDVSCRRD